MSKNKIRKLRKKFFKYNIDGYVIPKNDSYFNEYSSPDRLKFISNFDGSAGIAIILKKKNYLFVDGRYTLQANAQSGKNFEIIEHHKKKIWNILKHDIKLGFNPFCFTSLSLARNFKNYFKVIPIYKDLISLKISKKIDNKFYLLKDSVTGESSNAKIKRVLQFLKKDKSDCIFITAPENVSWLLNMRGKDNPYSPIPNCRLILKKNGEINLFAKKSKLGNLFKKNSSFKVKVINENKIKNFLNRGCYKKIIIDKQSCSLGYENILRKKSKISIKSDPIYQMKSIKNETEIKNIIRSHIFDGVAVTKFLYWIKNNNKKISELQAEKKLEFFRKKNKNYLFPSFNTISATGPNGAVIHYRANKSSNRIIKKNDIYLCDSGGQYNYGTTDITRTLNFKKQTKRIMNIFTCVLKGHIAVVTADLNKIKSADKLDNLARKFLKKEGLDYPHGTGHGVGFFLNVHEGPIAISRGYKIPLEAGQIITNEPGFYKKNNFGIRIENMIYIKEKGKKIFFDNLTMVPIEKNLINYNLLNKNEKDYLIKYNLEIYRNLEKYLSYNEKFWLLSQF